MWQVVSQMVSSKPHLPIFVPLYNPLPLSVRWTLQPASKVPLPSLSYKKDSVSHLAHCVLLSHLLVLIAVSCSMKRTEEIFGRQHSNSVQTPASY